MINYKFITEDKSEDIKAMSLKKAMRSFKNNEAKEVAVESKSRKVNISFYSYKLPHTFRKERKGK